MLHLMIMLSLMSIAISALLASGLPLVLGVVVNGFVAVFLCRADVDEESTAYAIDQDPKLPAAFH